MSKSCVGCSSFDPYYRGGWCDYHGCSVSPSDDCIDADSYGKHNEYDANKVCSSCRYFDPYARGGWCDCNHCTTNSGSYCSDFEY